jgi:hypothetical protein
MMKNRILRVAAPLGMPVTTRRVSGGLLIWRSSKEDLQQAQALTARRQTATPAPQCPRRQRTTPRRSRAARHTRSDPLDKWGRWGPILQFVGAKPTIHRRNSRAAAALSRGMLRWIRLPAGKRAVWVGFQAAHVRTPPPSVSDEEGFFYGVRCWGCHALAHLLYSFHRLSVASRASPPRDSQDHTGSPRPLTMVCGPPIRSSDIRRYPITEGYWYGEWYGEVV